jgi:hypothetical protein
MCDNGCLVKHCIINMLLANYYRQNGVIISLLFRHHFELWCIRLINPLSENYNAKRTEITLGICMTAINALITVILV